MTDQRDGASDLSSFTGLDGPECDRGPVGCVGDVEADLRPVGRAMMMWALLAIPAAILLAAVLVYPAKRADENSDSLTAEQVKRLRRQASEADLAVEETRAIYRENPGRATRLLMVHAEALRDMATAMLAKDWATARRFNAQLETIRALREIPDPPALPSSWHREQLEAAPWN